jgi:hypothetical protein
VSEREDVARKINPVYADGRLVRVAGAANQAEAEFIQNLLLEEGIPSTLRRAAGFDVPDFLAAGPRDILVAESGLVAAREVLLQSDLGEKLARPQTGFGNGDTRPSRLLAGLLGAVVLVAIIAWIGTELLA